MKLIMLSIKTSNNHVLQNHNSHFCETMDKRYGGIAYMIRKHLQEEMYCARRNT